MPRKGESTGLTVGHQWVDIYASSGTVEAHASIDQRKNRVVPAEPNVFSGVKFCPPLTHDDVAGDDHFAAEFFDTQPFADAVPAILNAALSFFVSHISVRRWILGLERWTLLVALFGSRLFRSYTDALDLYARQFAAMPNRPVIALAPPVLERDDFLVLALFHNFSSDLCPGYKRAPVRHVFSIGKHQHLAEGRGLAGIDIQKIDIDRVAFRDAKLPAAGFNNCVSHESEKKLAKVPQMGRFDKRKA